MAFHVDVEAEIFEGLWDISDPPEDDIYSQVSPDESEQEIPADVSTPHPPDSQAPGHKVPSKFARLFSNSRRWTISAAEFCCKVLVPAYSAGAVIGKRGKNLMKLQQRTQTMMTVSATHVFFPGGRVTISGYLRGVLVIRDSYYLGFSCRVPMFVSPQVHETACSSSWLRQREASPLVCTPSSRRQ